MTTKPLRITYGTELLHFGELSLPSGEGPHPVVVLIHGGFWRASYDLTLMNKLAENLADQGIAAWNIEYRRVGDTGGGWPGTLLDVALATDHLNTLAPMHNLDIQRIVPVGHSAGGQLALWLAARPRLAQDNPLAYTPTPLAVTGAISLAGAVDLHMTWQLNLGNGAAAEFLGGSPNDLPDRYAAASPAELLPMRVPQVLIHGDADDRVPITVSRTYAQKAQDMGDTVTLIELPGVDHFALIDPGSDAWRQTIQELRKLFSQV